MIPGILAGTPFGGSGESDYDHGNLLTPANFTLGTGVSWVNGEVDVPYTDLGGYWGYGDVNWKSPVDPVFVPGGYYVLSVKAPTLTSNTAGMQFDFRYRDAVLDQYLSVFMAGLDSFTRNGFSGRFRIPDNWLSTYVPFVSVGTNELDYDFILTSLYRYTFDPDELLVPEAFDLESQYDHGFDVLDLVLKPHNVSLAQETAPLKWSTSAPTEWVAGATYTIDGTAVTSGGSTSGTSMVFTFGYVDSGTSAFVTTGSSCNVVITEANAAAWSGTFTLSASWPGGINRPEMRFSSNAVNYIIRIKSIKAV